MRIGIIGTHWGRMHIGGFRGAGAEIVALCGRDPEATRRACAEEGVALATTDVAALCRAAELVVVASPDDCHAAHVRAAVEAGCHVLCEKPLTRLAADAGALALLAAGGDRVHAVNFPYRMLPPLQTLAAWLRGQGPARAAQVRVRNSFLSLGTGEGEHDDAMLGASGDLGGLSHVIDAGLWLLDAQPRDVQATLVGRPVGDAGLLLRLVGGATLAIVHVASVVPGIWGDWHIAGEGWEVRWSGGYVPALGGWQVGPVEVAGGEGRWQPLAPLVAPVAGRREPWAEAHVAAARAMLAAAAGQGRGALATLADGARVQRIVAAALRSEREGRRAEIVEPSAASA